MLDLLPIISLQDQSFTKNLSMEQDTSSAALQAVEHQDPTPTVTTNTSATASTSALAVSVATGASTPASEKPIHALVIDANAIIKNDPSVSTLLARADELYTIPAVVAEIRDEATRLRFQTTLAPFLKLRTPRPESVQFIITFARKTGDLQVLSRPDLQLLALTYELEIEKNGGDWRLRKDPTQRNLNGKPPGIEEKADLRQKESTEGSDIAIPEEYSVAVTEKKEGEEEKQLEQKTSASDTKASQAMTEPVTEQLEELKLDESTAGDNKSEEENPDDEPEDDSDGEWITPTNIRKYQARANALTVPEPVQETMKVALITADMAMRNVALRINLNLLDTGFSRITHLKTWILRCHGCYKVCKDTSKQFCPSCGQPTLTRVSCTTDAMGNFTLHLKKNWQWNNRGNVYSIPKPTHGSASGKGTHVKGGGKNGWGRELILAEDQKEYQKKLQEQRRTKYQDLLDPDYLPGILTGARSQSSGGRIRVGAGRNVNAKKRR